MTDKQSAYEKLELNGVYAMICSAQHEWHRMNGDPVKMVAAMVLKDLYSYEYHMMGGGCSWRKPEWDMQRVQAGLRLLGLRGNDPTQCGRVCAALLDGDPDPYLTLVGGKEPELSVPQRSADILGERLMVVEQFHNAFRRVSHDWDSTLNRRIMEDNLEQLVPLSAHAVSEERQGRVPDLRPLLDLCHKPAGA